MNYVTHFSFCRRSFEKLKIFIFPLVVLLVTPACKEQKVPKDYLHETPQEYQARMEWWKDARFGMFIHWGVYSVPAGIYHGKEVPGIGEWIMYSAKIPVDEYEQFARRFNPVKYDAEKWVKIAKDAGMKYIVITSKHHDGFCMWDSKLTNYDIVDFTPYGKDVLKALSEACAREGIHLGFYHSIMDWHHPDAHGDRFPLYRENYLKPQLKELLTGYGDIDIMWFDGEWIEEWTEEQGKDLYNYVRNLKPDIIVNNRVGKGRMGMQGMNKGEGYVGDFGTPEQGILGEKSDFSWETCMTMNDTWGFKKNDHNWKSAEMLIHNLVDIASKGGNYLLNVGPDSLGVIPEESVRRLQEMGDWTRINGEAIYGTRAFKYFAEKDFIRYTQSKDGKKVYAIMLRWPGDKVVLEAVKPAEGSDIYLLGDPDPLTWNYNETGDLVVMMPEKMNEPENRPCNYAWTLAIEGNASPMLKAPEVHTTSGAAGEEIWIVNADTLVLSTDTLPEDAEIRFTLDGSDPGPQARRYEKPFVVDRPAVVKARIFRNGKKAGFSGRTVIRHAGREKIPVTFYRYYEGIWDSLPDFSAMQPLSTGYLPRISLRDVHTADEGFGIVFSGSLEIPASGNYIFALRSDDGSKMFLGDHLLINNNGKHGYDEKMSEIYLKKGIIPYRIEYFQATGGSGLSARVKLPGSDTFLPLDKIMTNH